MINEKVYEILKEYSRKNEFITYSDLNKKCNLNLDFDNVEDRNKIAKILGDISTHENKNNRPLLSALVILTPRKTSSFSTRAPPISRTSPAKGFYNLVHRLKLKEPGETDEIFWIKEVGRCNQYWRNN
tara:strand:- start:25 stop:408 length:384 start_codon:yes stop_codon:yes gene_type:complete